MASPASIAKHPVHPMLVVFPLGLLIYSLVLDLIAAFKGMPDLYTVSYYLILGGFIGGLLAAIPGFVDFLSLKGKPRTIAAVHMILNLVVVILFIINFALRSTGTPVIPGPLILSIIAIILGAVSGWLGGELVYVQGVAVEVQKNPYP